MSGNPLPGKVAWRFRNVTGAFDFWPTLDSIQISDDQQDVTTFGCEVVDPALALAFANEQQIYVEHNGVKVFAGHIKVTEKAYRAEPGPRTWVVDGQDYSAKLDDSVIDHKKARAGEPLADRIDWILSFLNFSITTANVNLPSEDCDKADFEGMTVREALDYEAEEHRLSFYLDFDRDLHLFRTETVTAPWTLDDLTPDFYDSFPYREWRHSQDSVDLANAIWVMAEKWTGWVEDAPSIATYGRQERTVSAPDDVGTAQQAQRFGARALAETSQPQVDGTFVLEHPGLRAGMTIALSNDLHDMTAETFIITHVDISAVDPHDDEGEAYVRYAVTYSDRRRARPYRRPRKPARDATLTDGDAITLAHYTHHVVTGRLGLAAAFHYESIPDESDFTGPASVDHAIEQNSHPHNIPWTAGVCALGLGGWGGHLFREQWYEFDPGALTDTVGVKVTILLDDAEGYALVDGATLAVGVSATPPNDYAEGDFDVAGFIPAQDGTYEAFIPRSMLTPSTTQWLAIGANWRCQASGGSWVCSNEEPDITDVVANGLFFSGAVNVDTVSMVESVMDGTGLTDWVAVAGEADGANRIFTLADWSGKGRPQARIGAVLQAAGQDFDFDESTGEVTFHAPPPVGSAVAFRYRV